VIYILPVSDNIIEFFGQLDWAGCANYHLEISSHVYGMVMPSSGNAEDSYAQPQIYGG
jgi:hypothetical protein